MKVIASTTLQLEPLIREYKYVFSFNKKRGVDKDYWFTPSGVCKIWLGAISLHHVGEIDVKDYNKLVNQLKKNKCDVFEFGSDYYTVSGGNSISRIDWFYRILLNADVEWNSRKQLEYWI